MQLVTSTSPEMELCIYNQVGVDIKARQIYRPRDHLLIRFPFGVVRDLHASGSSPKHVHLHLPVIKHPFTSRIRTLFTTDIHLTH